MGTYLGRAPALALGDATRVPARRGQRRRMVQLQPLPAFGGIALSLQELGNPGNGRGLLLRLSRADRVDSTQPDPVLLHPGVKRANRAAPVQGTPPLRPVRARADDFERSRQ